MGHYGTLGTHSTILPLNKVLSNFPSNQDFLVFQEVWAHALCEVPPAKGSPLITQFCSASTHNLTLIPLVRKHHRPFPIHIVMVSFTLGLNPRGFVFGPLALYQLDIVYVYILISLPILKQCKTLNDVEHYGTLSAYPACYNNMALTTHLIFILIRGRNIRK